MKSLSEPKMEALWADLNYASSHLSRIHKTRIDWDRNWDEVDSIWIDFVC
jgi:hypothetical protein